MRSTPRAAFAARALALLSLLSTSSVYAAPSLDTDTRDAALQKRGALTYAGCYSSDESFTSAGTYVYQTSSYCQGKCPGQAVLGLSNGNACFCGNSLPPKSSLVSDSSCSTGCTGFGQDKCGGSGFYSVYTTGEGQLVQSPDSSTSTSSSSSSSSTTTSSPTTTATTASPTSESTSTPTTAEPSVVTSLTPGSTVIITQPASTTTATSNNSNGSSSGGGSNTAGIAAGVVVGIVALAAIIAGAFFFIRRRRQLAVEEEHRQRSQVSDFIAGGMERKNVGTSYSLSSDARLDPEAGRRNSVGSFMDDSQDYSRKILRVANPDD